MSSITANTFISTLINSGSDANLNLYEVTFSPQSNILNVDSSTINNTVSCRVVSFPNLIQKNNTTSDIVYQNISIPILNTGSDINRNLGFEIRLDEEYYILEKLRVLQSIDSLGNITYSKDKLINITLTAYTPSTENLNSFTYKSIYSWEFYNCYITQISPINFAYDSIGTGRITVNFIYEYFKESRETDTITETPSTP